MVKRSKSMERTIQEGNEYLRRMEQIERGQNQNQKQTSKRQSKKKDLHNHQKKAPLPQKQQKEQQKIQPNKKIQFQKKNEKQEPLKVSPKKIVKKTPKKQQQSQKKNNTQDQLMKGASTVIQQQIQPKQEKITQKQIQQTQQKNQIRKTKSIQSVQSDVNFVSVGMVDCVFVVDTTGSMDPYLERTTHTVELLVQRIKSESKNQSVSVKFGLVCYRDHPPQELTYVTEVHDLCSQKEILEAILKADCFGGGDGAEAALDGLNDAAQKILWRDSSKIPSLRYIFHICDQPPHGKEFGGYSEQWDDGCPCGLKPEQVIHRINVRQIHYRLIKANSTRLEKFASLFRQQIVNYDEVTLEDGIAEGMEIKISDMVIRELCPDILMD